MNFLNICSFIAWLFMGQTSEKKQYWVEWDKDGGKSCIYLGKFLDVVRYFVFISNYCRWSDI